LFVLCGTAVKIPLFRRTRAVRGIFRMAAVSFRVENASSLKISIISGILSC